MTLRSLFLPPSSDPGSSASVLGFETKHFMGFSGKDPMSLLMFGTALIKGSLDKNDLESLFTHITDGLTPRKNEIISHEKRSLATRIYFTDLPHALRLEVDSHPGFPHTIQFLSTFRISFASFFISALPSSWLRVRLQTNPRNSLPRYRFSHFFNQGSRAAFVSLVSNMGDSFGSLINAAKSVLRS